MPIKILMNQCLRQKIPSMPACTTRALNIQRIKIYLRTQSQSRYKEIYCSSTEDRMETLT